MESDIWHYPDGNKVVCPVCGEDKFKAVGYVDTAQREKQIQCLNCGEQF